MLQRDLPDGRTWWERTVSDVDRNARTTTEKLSFCNGLSTDLIAEGTEKSIGLVPSLGLD